MKSIAELMFPRGIDAVPPAVLEVGTDEESEKEAYDYRLYCVTRAKRGGKYVYNKSYADRFGIPYPLPPQTVDENDSPVDPVTDEEERTAELVLFFDSALDESEQRQEYKEAKGVARPEI